MQSSVQPSLHRRRRLLSCSLLFLALLCPAASRAWGFWAHKRIHAQAVWLLPPSMLVFYKPHAAWLSEHATDPDKRRYLLEEEGPRHYIDLDVFPDSLRWRMPQDWQAALRTFGEDSLQAHGHGPWWAERVFWQLVDAFKKGQASRILRLSADLGHYVADLHVPLHTHSNHNGQHSGQEGIHGFWESRIPELLAEEQFDWWMEPAEIIPYPAAYIWQRVYESHRASDSVLQTEKRLSLQTPAHQKFSYGLRNGMLVRQYADAFTIRYHLALKGMVERRMRQSIHSVASLWLTAWVLAGQPDLRPLSGPAWSPEETKEFERLQHAVHPRVANRPCEK